MLIFAHMFWIDQLYLLIKGIINDKPIVSRRPRPPPSTRTCDYTNLITIEINADTVTNNEHTQSTCNSLFSKPKDMTVDETVKEIDVVIGHRPDPLPPPPPPRTQPTLSKFNKEVPISKRLKIYHVNCQSCRNKTDEIHDTIIDYDMDILFLTETWLHQDGDEPVLTAITPSGYQAKSFPRRHRDGGGIAIIFRSSFAKNVSTKPILEYSTFEATETCFILNKASYNIICMYRHYSHNVTNNCSSYTYSKYYLKLIENYCLQATLLIEQTETRFPRAP